MRSVIGAGTPIVRCGPAVRVATERSGGPDGGMGRSVDAAAKKLEAKGWARPDAEHSATQRGHRGHCWRLTESGTAALES